MDFPIHDTPESTKSVTKLLQQEISNDDDSEEPSKPSDLKMEKSEERL